MNNLVKRTATALTLGSLFISTMLFAPAFIFSSLLFIILLIILTTEWPKLFPNNFIKAALISPVYPILPFLILIYLNNTGFAYLVYYVIFAVFAFDTGSYLAGNLFGKHKILPRVSPGKSWEGFVGGIFSIYITTIIFLNYTLKASSITNYPTDNIFFNHILIFILSILISFFALSGDLFESYLKRRVNLKDSGNLLPGHGGLLDRFDAIMFVAYLIFFIKILF